MVSIASDSARATRTGAPGLVGRIWMGLAVAILLVGISLMGLWLSGFQFIAIRGHSMEPTFSPGALLIARSAEPQALQARDIIAFSGAAGEPDIVHRIVSLERFPTLVATTMGDNNSVVDPEPVLLTGTAPRVLWSIPEAGWWFTPQTGRQMLIVSTLLVALAATREIARLTAQRKASPPVSRR